MRKETVSDSHFKTSSLNSGHGRRLWILSRVGSNGGGFVGGYMSTIPTEWQDDFGKPYLTGRRPRSRLFLALPPAQACSLSTSACSSAAGRRQRDADGVLPAGESVGAWKRRGTRCLTPRRKSAAWRSPTARIASYFSARTEPRLGVMQALGTNAATRRGARKVRMPPPISIKSGRMTRTICVDVKNGVKQPWDVQPYDVWNYETPFAINNGESGGVAYADAATGRSGRGPTVRRRRTPGDLCLPSRARASTDRVAARFFEYRRRRRIGRRRA